MTTFPTGGAPVIFRPFQLYIYRFCAAVCLVAAVPSWVLGQTATLHVDAEKLRRQAVECLELAETSVLSFYLPACLDHQNGGYLEELADNGTFKSSQTKFLTLQARQLWTFSTFASRGIREEECLSAARHGYEFIRNKFHDSEHGGYFNELNSDGSIKDPNKHAYLNSFVIYAFVAYYRASGDQSALAAALELFEVLDAKAYDRVNGGYHEFFHRDWKLVSDPAFGGIVGAVGTKTYNTHLHLLESFAELYRASQDAQVAARLAELLSINTLTVQHPIYPCNIDGWTPEWTMIPADSNLRASYGHDVECAWLVLDAASALGIHERPMRTWATKLVDYSLQYGYDTKNGGFHYTGPLGQKATDLRKEWWVQAEAMVCLLDMYRLSRDPKYLTFFDETFAFVKRHQIASEGGWWATRSADGSPVTNRSRSSKWQGGYHNGRALLRCSDLLHLLADQAAQ